MKVAESRTMLEASRVNLIIATLLGIALGTSAYGETYPHRPVRLIVPFAAGGLNDVVARLIAPYLERSLGQPFIVDNRPAASGIVGTNTAMLFRLGDHASPAQIWTFGTDFHAI